MSKDRSQYIAADRHKTKIGQQRKALAKIADAAIEAIRECEEGRAPGSAMTDLKRRVLAVQEELSNQPNRAKGE